MSAVAAEAVIEGLAAVPPQSALFSDFDGTLSKVVTDPAAAVPVDGAAGSLRLLGRVLGRVGVVSGRPAAFLAEHFAPGAGDRLELFGLHGLEHWTPGGVVPAAEAEPYAAVVADAITRAEAAGIPGMVIEDKVLAVTFHWRAARDVPGTPERAAALAEALAADLGLELRAGKLSAELVPPVGIDKGTVVGARGEGFRDVAFLGDDVGDVRAFSALDRLESGGARVARIAVGSTEAPPELLQRADLVLGGPEAAAAFLRELAAAASG